MADIQDAAERYIHDAGLVGTYDPAADDITRAVDDALREYSGARSRPVTTTGTVTADITVDLEAITGWSVGVSILTDVWADWSGAWADAIKEPQDADYWDTVVNPADGKLYLFWRTDAPDAAGTVGLKFSGIHTEATVPVTDQAGVGMLAAANMCAMVAAHYAEASKSTIGADSFLGSTQSREWRDLGRDLRKRYADAMTTGGGSDSAPFASATDAPDRDEMTGHPYGRMIYGDRE